MLDRIYGSLSKYRGAIPDGIAVPFGLDVPTGTEIRVSRTLFERWPSDAPDTPTARIFGLPVVVVEGKPADWYAIVVPEETGS